MIAALSLVATLALSPVTVTGDECPFITVDTGSHVTFVGVGPNSASFPAGTVHDFNVAGQPWVVWLETDDGYDVIDRGEGCDNPPTPTTQPTTPPTTVPDARADVTVNECRVDVTNVGDAPFEASFYVGEGLKQVTLQPGATDGVGFDGYSWAVVVDGNVIASGDENHCSSVTGDTTTTSAPAISATSIVATPTSTSQPSTTIQHVTADTLPYTGSGYAGWAMFATALIAFGATLAMASRPDRKVIR